jgi:hypothetical protein
MIAKKIDRERLCRSMIASDHEPKKKIDDHLATMRDQLFFLIEDFFILKK